MDVVDFVKHMYKVLDDRLEDETVAMRLGYIKSYDEYKRSVGIIEGLTHAREGMKDLLDRIHGDEDLED